MYSVYNRFIHKSFKYGVKRIYACANMQTMDEKYVVLNVK